MNEQAPDSGNAQGIEFPEAEQVDQLRGAASRLAGADSETVTNYYPRGDKEAPPALSVDLNEQGEIQLEIDDSEAPSSILKDKSPSPRSSTIVDLSRDVLSAEQTVDLTSYLEGVFESDGYRVELILKGAP